MFKKGLGLGIGVGLGLVIVREIYGSSIVGLKKFNKYLDKKLDHSYEDETVGIGFE